MIVALTIAASLWAILETFAIFSAAGMGAGSVGFFILWTSSPYLGFCALALGFRRNRRASGLILAGTILAGGLAIFVYEEDLRPYIEARERGVEPPMNCAGPLVEFGFPVLQWISFVVLGKVASITRPRQDAKDFAMDDG